MEFHIFVRRGQDTDRMQCALCGRSYTLVLVPVLVDQCQPRRKVTVQAQS
jgi:hypothetical protein